MTDVTFVVMASSALYFFVELESWQRNKLRHRPDKQHPGADSDNDIWHTEVGRTVSRLVIVHGPTTLIMCLCYTVTKTTAKRRISMKLLIDSTVRNFGVASYFNGQAELNVRVIVVREEGLVAYACLIGETSDVKLCVLDGGTGLEWLVEGIALPRDKHPYNATVRTAMIRAASAMLRTI